MIVVNYCSYKNMKKVKPDNYTYTCVALNTSTKSTNRVSKGEVIQYFRQ